MLKLEKPVNLLFFLKNFKNKNKNKNKNNKDNR
jgi:hypothetical protein